MPQEKSRAPIAGDVFLRALAEHGVDYFFANPGTDFPPIVEAFSRGRAGNARIPRPVLVPHENVAVAMAHGAYLMTGRPQVVMVHVNVGTANTINNLINLARDGVPLLLAAGRTPVTEAGNFGSRSRPIHWAQEMFDQAGMLREIVKWDYELRRPEQIGDVVARAYQAAMTSPRGPVYMILPREPLSSPVGDIDIAPPRALPAAPHPDPGTIATLANWLADAKRPLIITGATGGDAVAPLARLAERWAVPVVTHAPRTIGLPTDHAMHFGTDPGPLLAEADLVVVIETDVPWIPSLQHPPAGCRVAHMGEDPAFLRYPMRSFPCDLAITANAANAIAALDAALDGAAGNGQVPARQAALAKRNAARRAQLTDKSKPGDTISPEYLSRAIGEAVGEDAIVFNEYSLQLDHCGRSKPGTFFGLSPAGGLGWGVGAALGAKLAAPERFVAAVVGDGAYLFANPTVCSWVAQAHQLPVLTVIFNNNRYGAVRKATLSMFKDGAAGEDDGRFFADLDPAPPYDAIVRAHGGHAERVERPDELPAALARARDAVTKEGRQALLNVICPY